MDYNATTPLEPAVIQAVTEAMRDAWGNPSSSYVAGNSRVIRDNKGSQSALRLFFFSFDFIDHIFPCVEGQYRKCRYYAACIA